MDRGTGILHVVGRPKTWFIAVSLVTVLVSGFKAVSYIRAVLNMQELIRLRLDEAAARQLRYRAQIDGLRASYATMDDARNLLGLIALDDHSACALSLDEWQRTQEEVRVELDAIGAELLKLQPSRDVWLEDAGNRALNALASLNGRSGALPDKLALLEKSKDSTTRRVADALVQERGEIVTNLDDVATLLAREIARARRSAPTSYDEAQVEELARSTAFLTELLYSHQSLIQKEALIRRGALPVREAIAHLQIENADKVLARRARHRPSLAIVDREISRPFAATTWRVSAPGLNVRSGPSIRSRALCQLVRGDEVQVRSEEKGWWLANTPCGEGWVSASCLEKK